MKSTLAYGCAVIFMYMRKNMLTIRYAFISESMQEDDYLQSISLNAKTCKLFD